MAQQELGAPARFSAAAVLVAHATKPPLARHYKPSSQASICYWVQDGLIIEQQPFELAERCCSLAVFANAEGLDTDLSGMKLQKNSLYKKRRLALARVLGSWLKRSEANFERLMQSVGAGLSLLTAQPVVLIPSALAGLVFYGQYKGSTDKPRIAEAVTQAFQQLQTDWPDLVRSLRVKG